MMNIPALMRNAASMMYSMNHNNDAFANQLIEDLKIAAVEHEEALQNQSEKLQFMLAMTKLDFNIQLDEFGEFKSESTNAMFVGWMAKVNQK